MIAATIVAASLLVSSGASATYNSYAVDVEADAGSYSPVVLGENISLDACGSTLFLVNYSSYTSPLCELTNIGLFSVNWFAKNVGTGAFEWLTGGLGTDQDPDLSTIPAGTAAANSQTTVATGSGTFFDSVGTYQIGVYVAGGTGYTNFVEQYTSPYDSNTYNLNSYFGNDFASSLAMAESWNGEKNNGANWSSSFEVTAPVSVPEPESILMLLPALALMGIRERRRRRYIGTV